MGDLRGCSRAVRGGDAALLKKFDACPRSGTGDTTVFATCLGDTLSEVDTATTELLSTLTAFSGTATGACATSLAAYTNYMTPYRSSIASVQSAIDTENAAAFTSADSNAQTAAVGGKEQRTAFEGDCEPA